MVVDDERDVELLFRQKFRSEIRNGSISITFVFSAEEALAFLDGLKPFDVVLVLSDINMPGMTGLDLLRIIKERYRSLNVIMISAYGDEKNYNTAKSYGADDFVNKPVDFTLLKEKIFALQND
jgi:CheY-like chemotaxis protein